MFNLKTNIMKFGKRSLQNLHGQHPLLIWVLMEAIHTAKDDFTITDGGRTASQQGRLYAQGRTLPGPIVTNADGVRKKSNHQAKDDGFYHAVDLYPYVNGAVDVQNKSGKLAAIAAHIKATAKRLGVSIAWGGDWKGNLGDLPHFELLT